MASAVYHSRINISQPWWKSQRPTLVGLRPLINGGEGNGSYRNIIEKILPGYRPGWWFQTLFIFHNIWDNPSHWLIFFKMVQTTNQRLCWAICGLFFQTGSCKTYQAARFPQGPWGGAGVPCGRWHLAPGLLLHVWEYRWRPVNGLVLGELCKKACFFQQMWRVPRVPVDFPLNQWDALSKTATIAAMEDCNPFDLFASPHRSCEINLNDLNAVESQLAQTMKFNRGLTNGIRSFPAPSCAPFSLRIDPFYLLWVYHGLFHSWSNPCVFLQVKVQIMPVWMQIQPNPKGDLTQTCISI